MAASSAPCTSGKPPPQEQAVDAAGRAASDQGVERDDLRPGRLEGVEGVGVGERERGAPATARPGWAAPGRAAAPAVRACRTRRASADHGLQIDVRRRPLGQAVEGGADLRRVARRPAPGRDAGPATGRRRRGTGRRPPARRGARASRSIVSWPGGADRLSTTPATRDVGPEGGEAVYHGGDRLGHGGRRRRRAGPARRGAGATSAVDETVPSLRPVEETHHAFDDQHVAPCRGPAGERRHRVRAAQPGVEVPRRPSGREGVIARIDEVRAHLGGGRAVPGPAQGGHRARWRPSSSRPPSGCRPRPGGVRGALRSQRSGCQAGCPTCESVERPGRAR